MTVRDLPKKFTSKTVPYNVRGIVRQDGLNSIVEDHFWTESADAAATMFEEKYQLQEGIVTQVEDPNFKWYGAVSEATLRSEDLLPIFLEILRDLSPPEYELCKSSFAQTLIPYETGEFDLIDWESEEISWLMDYLYEQLNWLAPDGYYFGSLEGDGACIGFFLTEMDEEQEDICGRNDCNCGENH